MKPEIKSETELEIKLNGTDCFVKVQWLDKTPICVQFINEKGYIQEIAEKSPDDTLLSGDKWSIWSLPRKAAQIVFDGIKDVIKK